MRRFAVILCCFCHLSLMNAQPMEIIEAHKQQKFPDSIPAGNYSGITPLGQDRYAVVSDKSADDGFFVFHIAIDTLSGKIVSIENEGFHSTGKRNRDVEGIAYVPDTQTLFISGEAGNDILEYTLDGQHTGRGLVIPAVFKKAHRNFGFEALAYDAEQRLLWTTSEASLPGEGDTLRLQSFGLDLQPKRQYRYEMDGQLSERPIARGVSALCALGGNRLLVLEREAKVTKMKIGSWVHCKLFEVELTGEPSEAVVEKRLVMEFRTKINLLRRNFANYEGMCLGPRLADGSRTLIMIADSQDRHGGILRDWFKVIVFRE